ncbi:hypothetical protein DORFOR_01604 [Dorea formicigenerans ATCC 27755]|uniref:Uncharacterized protein n=1 Tax=Dorea formicigenerans ATCC 27755 TaxID=411461 RepID=B0G5R3_9FIRM|nr:hypothetical protein DORFOR_01604 [Dorea formicigenerans ATCC 27755]
MYYTLFHYILQGKTGMSRLFCLIIIFHITKKSPDSISGI